MIKAVSRTGLGEPLLFLGLSGENVTRLVAGEPILITSAQMAELGLRRGVKLLSRDGLRISCTASGPA